MVICLFFELAAAVMMFQPRSSDVWYSVSVDAFLYSVANWAYPFGFEFMFKVLTALRKRCFIVLFLLV